MLIPFVLTLQFILLHNLQCKIFATFSCLLLCSFYANFLHSTTMWETLSVCSPQSLQRGDSIDLSTWYLTMLGLLFLLSDHQFLIISKILPSQLYRAVLSQIACVSFSFSTLSDSAHSNSV